MWPLMNHIPNPHSLISFDCYLVHIIGDLSQPLFDLLHVFTLLLKLNGTSKQNKYEMEWKTVLMSVYYAHAQKISTQFWILWTRSFALRYNSTTTSAALIKSFLVKIYMLKNNIQVLLWHYAELECFLQSNYFCNLYDILTNSISKHSAPSGKVCWDFCTI